MQQRPTVTIGFYPRERFSAAGESLRSIVRNTAMPYRLIIVDAGTPAAVRAEMEDAVHSLADVRWIREERFLYANQSRNRIAAAADTDYVCFVENGLTVEPGWLEALVDACGTFPAGAATPKLMEYTPGTPAPIPHHERTFMRLLPFTGPGGVQGLRGIPDDPLRDERYARPDVHQVDTTEGHLNMFSRAALKAIAPFDESLTLGTHVDITCLLRHHGITLVMVPGAVVTHLPIVQLDPIDYGLHAFRYDVAKATASRDAIVKKWHLRGIANFGRFAHEQRLHRHAWLWKAAALINLPYRVAERLGLASYKK